ncbi:redox-sensitive bicupin YhaK (pirin superfamily) [Natronospira proteinivora]|uniref:Redox-sensitive bicupin YhaK (Pirin superfamily) n=1 Tax=Natronospira proteinivora TaxID=1807133 RepID=A0ABT1G8A8_9GAMM|nr:pirin family protein [Natronospira proteinivora]MCP1726548.1 redox-sensitive bicupin YhaK (pirin superfamily) [Natronospira proteinivora]
MKQIQATYSAPPRHWVGNGFPVRSLFSYDRHGHDISPFLLLDHAGPMDFEPADTPRGVGEHPHRGIETVTLVYDGEVEHLDSTGAGGKIGPGDVQWMTSGGGIQHQEFHSETFTRNGGRLEMVQLWVNLPAKDKMTQPGYQTLLDADFPRVDLADEAGQLRVIAGDYEGHQGPAKTFTPMNVWDLRLKPNAGTRLPMPEGWSGLVVVLKGTVQVNGDTVVREGELAVLGTEGEGALVEANNEALVLVLGGEPIDEPIVGYGPFVMNSQAEIQQTIEDFRSGRFGRVPPTAG